MNHMKSLSILVLLAASFLAQAHEKPQGECKSISLGNMVAERPAMIHMENYMVVDRHVKLWGLEASDCGNGFVINNLEVSSDRAELGYYRGSFNCITDFKPYAEDEFPNFNVLREVISGSSANGILEIQITGDTCVLRFHSSDHDVRSRNRDFFCNGSVASDERVTCQHVRHLKKKNLNKPTLGSSPGS